MNSDQIIQASFGPPKNEFLYKILVIGELGTGKTSFIKASLHLSQKNLWFFSKK